MISKAVHNKLKNTRLFSDAQKVELFALLPDATEEDIRKLEEGIDAFDRRFHQTVARRGRQIQELLTDVVSHMSEEDREKNQSAIDELNLGLAILAS